MSHANAALTLAPVSRWLGSSSPTDGRSRAAERFDVSWRTAKKWADRYEAEGPAGMLDRSSRAHHQPNRTSQPVVRKIVHLRWKQRLGPVEIADRLGMASSTVHAVLVRCRLNRLTHIDRATGERIRRYEHEHPGDLIHVAEESAATAVVCDDDLLAAALVTVCAERAVVVPDQLSIVGYGDLMVSRLVRPQLTTVHLPAAVGGLAMTRLIDAVRSRSARTRKRDLISVPVSLVERASSAPPPATR